MLTTRILFKTWKNIAPSDTLDLDAPTQAVYVGGAGDVAAVQIDGVVGGIFKGAAVGMVLPIAARRINATGTTATFLVALREGV